MNTSPSTVILANGDFPRHAVPLQALREAVRIVCCDGAAAGLLAADRDPNAIVGDLDSLPAELRARFAARLVHDPDQESNDLTKSVRYCLARGWHDLTILGATGRREDHTLANLALLADYAAQARVELLTDHGRFTPVLAPRSFASSTGEQVSIFALDSATHVTARGLRYPLEDLRLTRWWQGTLNESLGDAFELTFKGGPLLVFQCYRDTTGAGGIAEHSR